MPRKPRTRLIPNKREQQAVEEYVKGKSQVQACKDAGYTPLTAEKKAYAILNRPLVQSALTAALFDAGISFRDIMQPVKDGLAATRVTSGSDGKLRTTHLPDHKIRLESHDRAVALMGGIPKVGEATPVAHGLVLNLNFTTVTSGRRVVNPQPAANGHGNGHGNGHDPADEAPMPSGLAVRLNLPPNGKANGGNGHA